MITGAPSGRIGWPRDPTWPATWPFIELNRKKAFHELFNDGEFYGAVPESIRERLDREDHQAQ